MIPVSTMLEEDEEREGCEVHLSPALGREHEASPDCWCGPELDRAWLGPGCQKIWIHHTVH